MGRRSPRRLVRIRGLNVKPMDKYGIAPMSMTSDPGVSAIELASASLPIGDFNRV